MSLPHSPFTLPSQPRVVLLTSPSLMGIQIINRLAAAPGLQLVGVGFTNRVFKNVGLVGTISRVVRRSGWAYFRYALMESTVSWTRLSWKGEPRGLKSSGAATLLVNDVNSQVTADWLQQLAPDVIVSFYFNQWIGQATCDIAKVACVNVHPSLLPALRGPDPVFRALQRGVTESGVTIHAVAEAMDAGSIVHQVRLPLDVKASHFVTLRRLITAGADLLAGWLSGDVAAAGPIADPPPADYSTFPSTAEVRDFLRSGNRLYSSAEIRQVWREICQPG